MVRSAGRTGRGRVRTRLWARSVTAVLLGAATAVTLGAFPAPAEADTRVGSHMVGGRIGDAYWASGGIIKWGFPHQAEAPAANGGRFQTFDRGTFYWHPWVDDGTAHQVGGAIKAAWGATRWEWGPLGYPVTNEEDGARGSKMNEFQGGVIYWNSDLGAYPIWGKILERYEADGGARSGWGLPMSNEYRTSDGRFAQDFQGGTIFWP